MLLVKSKQQGKKCYSAQTGSILYTEEKGTESALARSTVYQCPHKDCEAVKMYISTPYLWKTQTEITIAYNKKLDLKILSSFYYKI